MPPEQVQDARTVERVRAFNRFYTRRLGVLSPRLLDSPFSLTEVRVMFELANRPGTTARGILHELHLDAGYLSRILKGLQRRGLISSSRSRDDARQVHLTLSAKGRRVFAGLDRRSSRQVREMLAQLPENERERLAGMMTDLRHLLDGPAEPGATAVNLRPPAPGDLGWVVQRHGALYAAEYGWDSRFEALVARIVADFGESHDPKRERCFIAQRDGQPVGCVFVVRADGATAQLRLLLVEPSARGQGIGQQLVAACLDFARTAGYTRMMLWTNSVLVSARRIYESAGFRRVRSKRHCSFGQELVGETWRRDL